MRLMLIVNPISGTRSKDALLPKLVDGLSARGFDVTTRLTTARGDATALATEAVAQHYDGVVVCGGDGTVNEAARALCDTSVPMAIIPAGSGNGLARHIGLSSDELAAIDIIDMDNVRPCDYGTVNGNKFFCTFGVGFDGAVAHRFAAQPKRGRSTYIRSIINEFGDYKPGRYTITIDGDNVIETHAFCVTCCNASQYGNNVYVAPHASITDGMLDLIIIRNAPHLQTIVAGLDMLTGMLPHNHHVDLVRCRRVRIEAHDNATAHIDGEAVDLGLTLDAHVCPGAINMFVKPSKHKFTPFITPIDNVLRDLVADVSKLFS